MPDLQTNTTSDRTAPVRDGRRWRSTLFWFAVATGAPVVCGAIGTVLASRACGPEVLGELATAGACGSLSIAIATDWLRYATSRFVPLLDPRELPCFIASGRQFFMPALAVTALLCGLFTWLATGSAVYLLPGALLGGLSAWQLYWHSVVVSLRLARPHAVNQVIYGVCRALLPLAAAIAAPAGLAPAAAIAGAAGASLVAGLATRRTAHLAGASGQAAAPEQAAAWRAQIVKIGIPAAWGAIAGVALVWGDRLLMRAWGSAGDAGVYAAAATLISGSLQLFAVPVVQTLYPSLVRQWHRGEREQVRRRLKTAAGVFLVLAALSPLCAPLLAAAARTLFGDRFAGVGALTLPLLLGAALGHASNWLSLELDLARKPAILARNGWLTAGALLASCAVGVAISGPTGAAWSNVAAGATSLCLAIWSVASYRHSTV